MVAFSHSSLKHYISLLRLNKPIGFFLLLWPTLMALWIAGEGHPPVNLVLVFVLGVFIMRAAGCVINDIVDRPFDGKVERTKHRPLALKHISFKNAMMVFIVLMVLAFILALQLDVVTLLLSSVALVLAMIYPWFKRFSHLPQLVLGLAFGWSIPMVFSAVQHSIPMSAYILYAATIAWVFAYDTQYAMVDRKDDLILGLKSSAILFARYDVVSIFLLHTLSVLLFYVLGQKLQLGMVYHLGLIAAAGLVVYQYYLVKDRIPARCFKAFMNNHPLGALLFAGIYFDYFFK